jgi:hypothetical protein
MYGTKILQLTLWWGEKDYADKQFVVAERNVGCGAAGLGTKERSNKQ